MKKKLWTGLATGALVLFMAGLAQAIPINFEYTGYAIPETIFGFSGPEDGNLTINFTVDSSQFVVNGFATIDNVEASFDYLSTDGDHFTDTWSGSVSRVSSNTANINQDIITYTRNPFASPNGINYQVVAKGFFPVDTDWWNLSGTISTNITSNDNIGFRDTAYPANTIEGQFVNYDITGTATPAPVPEPATMLLLGTGLVGLAGSRIRRKKSA